MNTSDAPRVGNERDFERKFFIWTVVSAPLFMIITGAFLQQFIILVGVRKSYIGLAVGLMSLLPSVAAFLFTAAIERKGLMSRVFAFAYIIRFSLVALLALTPSVLGYDNVEFISRAYVVIMVLIALCYTFGNICNESLVKEAVPQYRFGQYAARIAAWSGVAGIIPGLAAAYFADTFTGLRPLQLLLVVAGLGGAAVTIPFVRDHDFSAGNAIKRISLFTPFRDKVYMRYLAINSLATFFFVGSSSFWVFFMLEELEITLLTIVLTGAVCSLFAPVFSWIWGVVTDHFGARAAYIYSSFFTWLSCIILVLPMPPILCVALFCLFVGFYGGNGFFSRGRILAGIALRNAMMPRDQSATYIALFQLVAGTMGFFSGLAAGFALETMSGEYVFGLSPYRFLFLVANVVCGTLATFLFLLIKERHVVDVDIKRLGYALLNPMAFKNFYAIAMVNNSGSLAALEKTVKRLATRSTYLGRTELLRNFRSPSLRIRRQAVKGLGYIYDKEVLAALREEVTSRQSPIASECIDALETLGAVDVLTDLFTNYHGMPKEIRMRLILAALNVNTEVFKDLLKRALVNENEMDIGSEIILGLSGQGEWQIGISALDRMSNKYLSNEQESRLWLALANLFSWRVKAFSLMSAEMREFGAKVAAKGFVSDEKMLKAYLAGRGGAFHSLASSAVNDRKDWISRCFKVSGEDEKTILFIIDKIVEYTLSNNRQAMLVTLIILHELDGFIDEQRR